MQVNKCRFFVTDFQIGLNIFVLSGISVKNNKKKPVKVPFNP
ncbi:hypothetical protein NT05LI_2818 [Listeria ivanovii FSL F6-596]|nr:hypothetical protein NT05LI_2818 [Listeria ivanovii FSL F6-596]